MPRLCSSGVRVSSAPWSTSVGTGEVAVPAGSGGALGTAGQPTHCPSRPLVPTTVTGENGANGARPRRLSSAVAWRSRRRRGRLRGVPGQRGLAARGGQEQRERDVRLGHRGAALGSGQAQQRSTVAAQSGGGGRRDLAAQDGIEVPVHQRPEQRGLRRPCALGLALGREHPAPQRALAQPGRQAGNGARPARLERVQHARLGEQRLAAERVGAGQGARRVHDLAHDRLGMAAHVLARPRARRRTPTAASAAATRARRGRPRCPRPCRSCGSSRGAGRAHARSARERSTGARA